MTVRYPLPPLREILGSNRVRGKWAAQTGVDGKYNHCAWGESALADQEEGRTLNLFATGSQMAIASILYRRCGGFRLELWGYNVIPFGDPRFTHSDIRCVSCKDVHHSTPE